jgi:hypothetical protein
MNPEHIAEIIDLVAKTEGDAFMIIVAMVGYQYVKLFVVASLVCTAGWIVYKLIGVALTDGSEMTKVVELVNMYNKNGYQKRDSSSPYDREKSVEELRMLLEKYVK